MYNLLLSLGAAVLVASLVLVAGFPWVSAIIPAFLVFPLALFLLARRTGQAIQEELAPLGEMLQAGKVEEAKALIIQVRDAKAPWQFLLHGQLTGQLGMISYMQMKFDEAQPLLEASGGRDWSALVALGCVHYRQKRFDEAWESFKSAAGVSDKELIIYIVWATLLHRKGLRSEALSALSRGLEALPDNPTLRQMKNKMANKRKLDTSKYPDGWYQFFPEEAAQKYMMRGRRGTPELPPGVRAQAQMGRPQPRARGKLARRR